MVYCASSLSLAALETAVHLAAGDLPLNRFAVCVEIPEGIWAARVTRDARSLPVGWTAIPAGKVSLDVGGAWLSSLDSAVLVVPSVVVPEESSIIINPRHPDAGRITAAKVRPWHFDGRLKR